MATEIIHINDFKGGIITDETLQTTNTFHDMEGVNLWEEPGTLQINSAYKTPWTFTGTNTLQAFQWFEAANKFIWAEDNTNKFHYTTDWNTWTQLAQTAWGTWNIVNFVEYNSVLLYWLDWAWSTVLEYIASDLTTTNSFQTFANDVNPVIWVVFQNRAYFTNGNNVAELDGSAAPGTPGSWVWDDDAFVIPDEETILTMTVFSDRLAIGTDLWNVYIWDWASDNADQIITTSFGPVYRLLELDNTLYMFAWFGNSRNEPYYIRQFNGSDFVPVMQIPDGQFIDRHDNVWLYLNGFFMLTEDQSTTTNRKVWQVNRNSAGEPLALTRYGNYWTNTQAPNGFMVKRWYLFVWHNDDTLEYIALWQSTKQTLTNFIETQKYEVKDTKWFNRLIKAIQWLGSNATIQYSIDWWAYTPWTAATLTKDVMYRIQKRANTIQFKITAMADWFTWLRVYA